MIVLYPYAKSKVDNNLKEHFTNIILLSINHLLANLVTAILLLFLFRSCSVFSLSLFLKKMQFSL